MRKNPAIAMIYRDSNLRGDPCGGSATPRLVKRSEPPALVLLHKKTIGELIAILQCPKHGDGFVAICFPHGLAIEPTAARVTMVTAQSPADTLDGVFSKYHRMPLRLAGVWP